MKVLVVGSGGGAGREHAICWKLFQSKHVKQIFCSSGNPGTAEVAENIDIKADNISSLADFAEKEKIDLTFVGPEAPLVAGIVDEFGRRGLKIFGPSAAAARLEGSKDFSKSIMLASGIPTARHRTITSMEEARDAIKEFQKAAVKADGLAGGKGVIICHNRTEITEAVNTLMNESLFGRAGKKIVIEELLEGEEATVLAFCDGKTAKLMVPSQDHKRIFDGDKGPNTGGMGAYAPAPTVSGLEKQIHDTIFIPVLKEMARKGTPYVGILYAGLMVKDGKFNVLEFNARFGDPEAQPVLSLLESDLVEIAQACLEGKLSDKEIKWKEGAACSVVISSKGYPGTYSTGKVITGIEEAEKLKAVRIFQGSTKRDGDKTVTSGGRVLSITGIGQSIKEAIDNAYLGVSCIRFDGMHYRKDIGKAVLQER
jgi:phosphoribosylamine--glycine ligase